MMPDRSAWGWVDSVFPRRDVARAAMAMALISVALCTLSAPVLSQTIKVSGRARIYPVNGAPIDADSWWQEEGITFYKIGEIIHGMPRRNVDRIEGLPPLASKPRIEKPSPPRAMRQASHW
jgi:hypothetical protein